MANAHGIICFLRDEATRTRWRFAVATRAVVEFNRAESRRLGTPVYSKHTPLHGAAPEVAKLEAFFVNYAQGDGWFGPITDEQMTAVVERIRKEGPAILEGDPLP